MTASDVLFDTWAWWELFGGTPLGRRLRKRYLRARAVSVHTSAITCGELTAKLVRLGQESRVQEVMATLRMRSRLHDVTPEIAEEAGRLRAVLRRAEPDAGLADAIILATARSIGALVISDDSAFTGQADVKSR